jgi:ATP-binding cassette subfamily C protein
MSMASSPRWPGPSSPGWRRRTDLGGITSILRLYFATSPSRSLAIVGCLLLAALFEGVGVAALLPLVTVAVGDPAETGAFGATVADVLARLGIGQSLGTLLLVVAGALLLKSLVQAGAMVYVGFAAAERVTELRREVVAALLEARWGFLLRQRTGRLSTVLASECSRAGELYVQTGTLLALSIQSLTYLGVALFVSWQVAIGALVLGSLVMVGLRSFVQYARRNAAKAIAVQRRLLSIFLDALRSVKPLKAMGQERVFSALLNRNISRARRLQRRAALNREAMSSIQEAAGTVMLCAAFYALWTMQVTPLPELLVSSFLLVRILGMLGKLQKAYQRAVVLERAHTATAELIDLSRRDREPAAGTRAPRFERAICFEHVELRHIDALALEDVTLEIPAGRCTVLLGPSGAGKTSIVDLVLGLYRPTAGRVLVDDCPLEEFDLHAWRLGIGYVPQEFVLLHDTIRANVALGDEAYSDADVLRALEQAGAAELVAGLPEGLDTRVAEGGARFSGGERQRIALARALVRKPHLLILDEITSALDEQTAREVAVQIRALIGATTVLAITHRPELLELADVVHRIEKGRLAETERSATGSGA